MTNIEFKPIAIWFTESPDTGHPDCICTLCWKPIGEGVVPIRLWNQDTNYEARFHIDCYTQDTQNPPKEKRPSILVETVQPFINQNEEDLKQLIIDTLAFHKIQTAWKKHSNSN